MVFSPILLKVGSQLYSNCQLFRNIPYFGENCHVRLESGKSPPTAVETHRVGVAEHLAEGVVDVLVAFQLSLTQRHQIILHLLVDPAVQHLHRKMTR